LVVIATHNESGNVRPLIEDLVSVFHDAGWEVQRDMVFWTGAPPGPGLTVSIPDLANPSPAAAAVLRALNSLTLPRTLRSQATLMDHPAKDVSIIVTAP
jgi:hypothetical protein